MPTPSPGCPLVTLCATIVRKPPRYSHDNQLPP
nr:MAG TPA: hypothetical protein [Caudoviricetes sp.]